LEHIKEDDLAIIELYRILKDGGIVFITVPHMERMVKYTEPTPAVKIKRGRSPYAPRGGMHFRNGYKLSSLSSLLKQNGFVVIAHNYTSVPNVLQRTILFPLAYPLSLIFGRFSGNHLYLNVSQRRPKSYRARGNSR